MEADITMCIIVVKPMGEDFPSNKTLLNCFTNNRHGAGFMFNRPDGKIEIRKGFMTFEDFMTAYEQVKTEIDPMKQTLVLHFRLATQGLVSEENCHPFPVSANEEDLKAENLVVERAFVHNGVISFCSTKTRKAGQGWTLVNEISDTMIFSRDYLSQIPDLSNVAVQNLIAHSTNSRFCILQNDEFYLIGNFIKEKDGCFYSNNSYQPKKATYITTTKPRVQITQTPKTEAEIKKAAKKGKKEKVKTTGDEVDGQFWGRFGKENYLNHKDLMGIDEI